MNIQLPLRLIDIGTELTEGSTSVIRPTQNSKSRGSAAPETEVLRPIHYLGSKLRLLDIICETINKVDPARGTVCDLFAGSGTVSKAISGSRNVIAVDIQEYSRVLSSALLNGVSFDGFCIEEYLQELLDSTHFNKLIWALQPLISYEQKCLQLAHSKSLEPLCDLLENGSIVAFESGLRLPQQPQLNKALAESVKRIKEASLDIGPKGLASRYYGGIYFSYNQAVYLDIFLEGATQFIGTKRDVFIAAVLSTASDIVNTVGKQFAQPIRPRTSDGKPKKNLANQAWRDRSLNVKQIYKIWLQRYLNNRLSDLNHKAIRSDYLDFLKGYKDKGDISVVYADPPYTRDHYSRFYHVLETLCLRDNPDISTVRINGEDQISRGLYRQQRHQSPFCIKTQAPQAFATLFSEVGRLKVPLVLSYSPYEKNSGARPRLMSIKEITCLAKNAFSKVEVISAGRISHNKLNNTEKNTDVTYDAEVLFVCEP